MKAVFEIKKLALNLAAAALATVIFFFGFFLFFFVFFVFFWHNIYYFFYLQHRPLFFKNAFRKPLIFLITLGFILQ